ncbi:MAG: class I SAM-dependent methyltransferase, partial [Neisseria mucosa]|nr:class I SAM-dependent methyltransferase [Neisseria mucosa]
MLLENILPFTHSLLRQALKAGGRALDATAGNGHDTLLLAQLVGETGKVWAFDVQSKALAQTQGRLKENGVDGRVALIHDGHENLLSY